MSSASSPAPPSSVGGAASADAQTFYRSIEGGAIALRDAPGAPLTHTVAGTYTFEVRDADTIHNFHLLGTAVDTPIDETGGPALAHARPCARARV